MLLDLRKFFVPFPPLHSSCITQDFLPSHIMKSKNIVYLNSFNIIIWSFFSFNIQNIQFLSHPLAQVSTNHTRNGNAFSLSRVVLSSFYLTAPLQHFQLEMCAVASCSKNWPSSLTLIQTLSYFPREAFFSEHINPCLSKLIPNVFTRNHKGIV